MRSFLSRLMTGTSADAADVFRHLVDGRDDADDRHLLLDKDDDNYTNCTVWAKLGTVQYRFLVFSRKLIVRAKIQYSTVLIPGF